MLKLDYNKEYFTRVTLHECPKCYGWRAIGLLTQKGWTGSLQPIIYHFKNKYNAFIIVKWLETVNKMYYTNGLAFQHHFNAKPCALSWNPIKIHNLANKPKFAYWALNINQPRCHSTIKRVWGCTNHQDGNRFHIYGDTTPAMSSLFKPQLFTEGEGYTNHPTMPYMAVTSIVKALTGDLWWSPRPFTE